MGRIILAILAISFSVNGAEPRFVYPLPADSAVAVQANLVYKTLPGASLHFDLYRPANQPSGTALPLVMFMNGVGSGHMRESPQYTSWGKLVTSIGMAGVVFDSHEGGVPEDATDLLNYLRQHAAELHVDPMTMILWACSANARSGLPLAMDARQTAIKAAVFYYGALDEIKGLRMELPVMVVRAGLDSPGLNRGLDQLVARASALNAPLTFINIPAAHHAFDIVDDNDTSRAAIARTLDFMKNQILSGTQRDIVNGLGEATAAAAVYRQDWASAVKAYEVLALSRPEDTEVRRNFGNALLEAGQYRRAIGEYERALELGNSNVGWISYSVASAYMQLGETDAALNWVEKLKDNLPMRRGLLTDPAFATLKNNPRFKAVAGRK